MTAVTAAREHLEAALVTAVLPVHRGVQRKRVDFIEDYLFIGGDNMPAAQAAARLGVNPRTVWRWRAVLRQLRATS